MIWNKQYSFIVHGIVFISLAYFLSLAVSKFVWPEGGAKFPYLCLGMRSFFCLQICLWLGVTFVVFWERKVVKKRSNTKIHTDIKKRPSLKMIFKSAMSRKWTENFEMRKQTNLGCPFLLLCLQNMQTRPAHRDICTHTILSYKVTHTKTNTHKSGQNTWTNHTHISPQTHLL